MDFAAAGLLDGLQGAERSARLKLLERLAEDGVGLEELIEAVAEDRLPLLPLERALGGQGTAREIAERAGIETDWLIRIWRALGLPEVGADDRLFSDTDAEAARGLKLLLEAGLPEDAVIEATRVLGESMTRFAATAAALFVRTFLRRGDSELDVALRYEAMARQLTPTVMPILSAALSAHLREGARRGMLGRAERDSGRLPAEQDVVVCFADMVGFTALGGQIAAERLGIVAGQLAELAAEVAVRPVRLVKTIGDAAMFVSPHAPPLVQAALELNEAVERAELPELRTGLASGPALQRAGDWYGNAVNLASRVTALARPGSVLATEEVMSAAVHGFAWSYTGRHRLKGIDEPLRLHRARLVSRSPDPLPGAPQGSRQA